MEGFDKHMALDVLEDALTDIDSAQGRGMAIGLCGAFYMCGLINPEEWKEYLRRIQTERHDAGTDTIRRFEGAMAREHVGALN